MTANFKTRVHVAVVVAGTCGLAMSWVLACGSSTTTGAPPGETTSVAGDVGFFRENEAGSTLGSGVTDASLAEDASSPRGDASLPATDAGGATSSAIPFSATGPWRAKLPSTTPLAANSAQLVAQIQSDITTYYGTWTINTDTFSSPYFDVPAGTQTESWTWNNCQKQGSIDSAFAASLLNIPTSSSFLASKGTDSEIAIYSRESDTYWDFWVAEFDAGVSGKKNWSACYGGVIEHASTNPGIFANGLGATAAGLPLGGWLLRIAELQAGVIEHALGFQIVHTQATAFSWPANRTDGKTSGASYPMEGQRFRLDPTFDITTLPTPAERMIAKALQDYGMLLTDTSGAVVLQAEDERPYMALHGGVDPYPAIWSNLPAYSVLKDIPIARLQALPQDYGKDFMK